MNEIDNNAKVICNFLLNDLIETSQIDNSIKFFRKDITTMLIWLFIIDSHSNGKKINIEDIDRHISIATRVSKPSLRLILQHAKEKGFIKFTHNQKDHRSWIVEPEQVALNEFNVWIKKWSKI